MNLESGLYMLFGLSIHFPELSQAQNLEPSSSHATACLQCIHCSLQPHYSTLGGENSQEEMQSLMLPSWCYVTPC